MPSNSRKPQPNLTKPSEGGSFNAGKKNTESTNPLQGLNITAERELGSAGGIKATGKLTVGVDNLIGQQGIDIEIDATNRTLGFGAGIGSTKGKLGVNVGGKIGYDEEGKIKIKGAEAGINIGGFGGSASIDEDEGIRGSVSVAGAKVEIGIGKDGKKTISLCYGVPGGELCVTFEPDPGIETPTPEPEPTPSPTPSPTTETPGTTTNIGAIKPINPALIGCVAEELYQTTSSDYWFTYAQQGFRKKVTIKDGFNTQSTSTTTISDYYVSFSTYNNNTGSQIKEVRTVTSIMTNGEYTLNEGFSKRYRRFITNGLPAIQLGNSYEKVREDVIKKLSAAEWGAGDGFTFRIEFECPNDKKPSLKFLPPTKIQLPNYPQHLKPMDCCEKVDEIYKYLGIAKLKKNKFPVSNAFLVPGGSGSDNCFDYYAITQALFRMLANGLIINPKSKPLGSEWQNTNATAWAGAMYEMMAESMSDGNNTQRFEVAAIMQLTQMMSTLAENGRKIEFVADAIGIEPLPVPENVPVCFTIYEGHKGFGKKEPKKINVSGLKTDDDVEKVLGKMLNPSLIPITAWTFKPGQISIFEALRNG
jgi:hypothetical protein